MHAVQKTALSWSINLDYMQHVKQWKLFLTEITARLSIAE